MILRDMGFITSVLEPTRLFARRQINSYSTLDNFRQMGLSYNLTFYWITFEILRKISVITD